MWVTSSFNESHSIRARIQSLQSDPVRKITAPTLCRSVGNSPSPVGLLACAFVIDRVRRVIVDDARSQRGRRQDDRQGRHVAMAACDRHDAQRAAPGNKWVERPGGVGRPAQRRSNPRVVDRRWQAGRQRRFVRHRHDVGWRWFLLCRGRSEHLGVGAMSCLLGRPQSCRVIY